MNGFEEADTTTGDESDHRLTDALEAYLLAKTKAGGRKLPTERGAGRSELDRVRGRTSRRPDVRGVPPSDLESYAQ